MDEEKLRLTEEIQQRIQAHCAKLLQAGQKLRHTLELGIRRNLLYKWAETISNHSVRNVNDFVIRLLGLLTVMG